MSHCFLCIHGHFYQPPRTDPFTGRIPHEPTAVPYANWNERIHAECYAPNAKAGHFGRISFNLGGTLARWLDEYAHTTYERIVTDEQAHRNTWGAGNGVAQPVHHTILPLARRRDRICQVQWGIASFRHRFGHDPVGMWLPEMAVDYETLGILRDAGIHFTILSDEQVEGDLSAGAGPYRVRLPDGGEIGVFVRDRHLSNSLSFEMPSPEDVDDWAYAQLTWRCRDDHLLLIATDGETFGHHHRQGVATLARILASGDRHGYQITTLGAYWHQHPPTAEVEIIENTAWSCAHHLDRWVIGCECTSGDSRWKGALRRALDNLASDLDLVYQCEAQRLGFAPWPLRDDYITVVLGVMDRPELLATHGLGHLTANESQRAMYLLEAQFYRQRMYTSCTFFFEDLDRLEPQYAIAHGIRALALTRYATGEDLTHRFRRDLAIAVSNRTGRSGADIFDALIDRGRVRV